MVSFDSLVSLTKDAREFVLSAHTQRKGHVRRTQGEGSHTRREYSPETDHAGILTLDFQTPEL